MEIYNNCYKLIIINYYNYYNDCGIITSRINSMKISSIIIALFICTLTVLNSLTRSSITMLWYFKFMMAAMDSSLDFISVGPNTTPRLLAAIKFLLECAATLEGHRHRHRQRHFYFHFIFQNLSDLVQYFKQTKG